MMFALVQEEVLGATDPLPDLRAAGLDVCHFSALDGADWRERLLDFDRQVDSGMLGAIFVSINVADFIRKRCPALRQHLAYRPEALHYHAWSSLVPGNVQLNRDFMMLPFGFLADRQAMLRKAYGDRLFLRPDSPRKPFSGLTCATIDLPGTVAMLRQTHAVANDMLVVVDRARNISPFEYRFWLADGEVVSVAGYMFGQHGMMPGVVIPPCPDALVRLAESLLRRAPFLETIDCLLVADLVMEDESPRLIELNAWSTSGFYPGVDVVRLAEANGVMALLAGTAPDSVAI